VLRYSTRMSFYLNSLSNETGCSESSHLTRNRYLLSHRRFAAVYEHSLLHDFFICSREHPGLQVSSWCLRLVHAAGLPHLRRFLAGVSRILGAFHMRSGGVRILRVNRFARFKTSVLGAPPFLYLLFPRQRNTSSFAGPPWYPAPGGACGHCSRGATPRH